MQEPVPGISAVPDETNARYFHVVVAGKNSNFLRSCLDLVPDNFTPITSGKVSVGGSPRGEVSSSLDFDQRKYIRPDPESCVKLEKYLFQVQKVHLLRAECSS